MSALLTMVDVRAVETACLTGGDQVAFTGRSMLHVLRSYRQAIALIRSIGSVDSPTDEEDIRLFLEVVDAPEASA